MDPATAITRLMDGYTRYSTGRPEHPRQTAADRAETALAPRPLAVILGCADARVPPEVIFDQGLGDLFVVRIAGNVVTDEVLGSIEVAVLEMAAPLVVVLGHTRCRAVQTALEASDGSAAVTGHVSSIVEALLPVVARSPQTDPPAAVRENVRHVVAALRSSEPVIAPAVHGGTLDVRGWLYDVESGLVEMLV
jgi:carbonic anhydrase